MNFEEEVFEFNWNLLGEKRFCEGRKSIEWILLNFFRG